jgi:S1-C subfamily serine protease
VLAVEVVRGGPADEAGLRPGDLILTIAGKPAESVDAVHAILSKERIGGEAELLILRDGALQKAKLRIRERPAG